MDTSGQFIRSFGQKREGKPSGLHIADKYVYVSDVIGHCILVYETSGLFVTSFGKFGVTDYDGPRCITSCADGHIHMCNWGDNRVEIF